MDSNQAGSVTAPVWCSASVGVTDSDGELLRNVAPAGWKNPAPASVYDLVVIVPVRRDSLLPPVRPDLGLAWL